jgi:alpha-amylase
MRLNIICIVSFLMAVTSCDKQSEKNESSKSNWPEGGIAYEIFVQSFYDSDGDSIGDIPGMTQKLDYLKEFNVDAVWLMPIMASPSYHKYDVVDYKEIHPDYGTMEDFKNFVNEAHARGIKVIIDYIINHTSSEHPWFKDAKSGPQAKYRGYYVWANKDSIALQIAKKETSFDSDNITQWHAVDGDTLSEHYYGFFYGGMPDLNFDNPALRKEIYDIGKFWLQEVGVDGFRMDAAKHIFPDDRAEDGHAFWAEFKHEMEMVKPDVYIVGEVWANTTTQAPFVKGFSALFDFDLAFSILETVNRGKSVSASIAGHGWQVDTTQSFIESVINNDRIYKAVNPDYVDAIFLTNHDQNRAMSMLGNDVNKAKIAASIMMTLPGTPYIYYGEEIGMKGMKPDPNIREPFLWSASEDTGRTRWMSSSFSTENTVVPLSTQQKDSNSLFNHYKNLTSIRKNNGILTDGEIKPFENANQNLLAFQRNIEGQTVIIVHNLSNQEQKTSIQEIEAVILGDEAWIIDDVLTIPAYKSVIIKID